MALNYLLDPMFQIENTAGKPATDGWLEVYIHGTRTKYYCASNFDGTLHPFKIKLDSLGSNIVLADDGQAYDVYAYNRFGSLLMSRYNVQPGKGGSGSGGLVSELQHWLGGYGPTYTPFPGDDIGHTLGISTGRLQGSGGVDYVGDFIDRIETCPYPDGVYDGYIYLKPGLYYIDCIIRYQQASDSLSNTLDEVLVYTGYGNANESLAYQFDSTGPEATGNRHNVRVSFVRHVTENEGSILYFAPATPVNWKEAYIQKLQIVKLDGVKGERGDEGKSAYEVWLDQGNTGTEQDFLDSLQGEQGPQGIQGPQGEQGPQGPTGPKGADGDVSFDELTPEQLEELRGPAGPTGPQGEQGPQGIQGERGPAGATGATGAAGHDGTTPPVVPLVAGDNISITESNGSVVISATGGGSTYTAGTGVDITNDVISVDTDTVAMKSDLPSEEAVQFEEFDPSDYQPKLTAGTGVDITNDVISVDSSTVAMKSDLPSEEAVQFEEFDPSNYQEKLTAGTGIDITNNVISVDPDDLPAGPTGPQGPAGPQGATGADGESAYDIWLDQGNVGTEQDFLDSLEGPQGPQGIQGIQGVQGPTGPAGETGATGPQGPKGDTGATGPAGAVPPGLNLVAGANINITATGNSIEISATGGGSTYTAGEGIDITNNVISIDPDDLPAGPTGPQGPAGADGADGKSAYEIWLDQGNTGSEQDFLDSLEGPAGPQGIQGIQGVQGPTGPAGPKGDTGDTGPAGTVPPGLNLVAGDNISITSNGSTVTIGATGVATTAQLAGKADSATTIAGYGITDAYTKSEVNSSLAGKQGTLTGITDVQVVQSPPASPVSTVLYLIPEA